MNCTVENCDQQATQRFVWAWGEEGACCTQHRWALERVADQVGRKIVFSEPSDKRAAPIEPPPPPPESPELGALRMALAEAHERIKQRDDTIERLQSDIATLETHLMASGGEPRPATVLARRTSPTEPPEAPIEVLKKKR